MDLEQAIHTLREAQGDPARLGLASVDLLLAGHQDEEREKVRTALEVSAMPHWFDEKILAALLDLPLAADAEALATKLRRLPVVEAFPARGPGAANVHEATRLALRARMKAESPERLRVLSTGARARVADETAPHARIEALYHRFTAEPEAAAPECDALAEEWDGAGRYEALLGLGLVLDELLQEGLRKASCAAQRSTGSPASASIISRSESPPRKPAQRSRNISAAGTIRGLR